MCSGKRPYSSPATRPVRLSNTFVARRYTRSGVQAPIIVERALPRERMVEPGPSQVCAVRARSLLRH